MDKKSIRVTLSILAIKGLALFVGMSVLLALLAMRIVLATTIAVASRLNHILRFT